MTSTRLPGKIMMPLAGVPLLQRIIERVRPAAGLDALAVATTALPSDDCVAELCRSVELPCYRGSETDVLGRIWEAATALDAEVLVRLTGDNPMVNHELVDGLVGHFLSAKPPVDYANTAEGSGFPYGLIAEIVRMTTLAQARESDDPNDREHVTWFIRQRPELFRQSRYMSPLPFPDARLTVDTETDYRQVGGLFEALYAHDPTFGLAAIANALNKDAGT